MCIVRNLFAHTLFILPEDNPLDRGNTSEDAARQQYFNEENAGQKVRKLQKARKWMKIIDYSLFIFVLAIIIIAFVYSVLLVDYANATGPERNEITQTLVFSIVFTLFFVVVVVLERHSLVVINVNLLNNKIMHASKILVVITIAGKKGEKRIKTHTTE